MGKLASGQEPGNTQPPSVFRFGLALFIKIDRTNPRTLAKLATAVTIALTLLIKLALLWVARP